MLVAQKPVPSQEEIENMTVEEYKQFLFDYYNGSFKHAGLKPRFFDKMKYRFKTLMITIIALAVIGIIFGVINLVSVGAQDLWHSKDKSKLTEIQHYLDETSPQIDQYEVEINDGTISEKDYGLYQLMIVNYNKKVDEYNKLADKVGTTYYLVPMGHGR